MLSSRVLDQHETQLQCQVPESRWSCTSHMGHECMSNLFMCAVCENSSLLTCFWCLVLDLQLLVLDHDNALAHFHSLKLLFPADALRKRKVPGSTLFKHCSEQIHHRMCWFIITLYSEASDGSSLLPDP